MGAMLRSDPMTLCDMYIQPEAAFEILSGLGEEGCVQFHDMNEGVQAFQRKFVPEVCRYAEMERKLHYMEEEMTKDNIYVPPLLSEPKALEPTETRAYESAIEKWSNDIIAISTNQKELEKNYLGMTEMHYVLERIGPLLGTADIRLRAAGKTADIESSGRLKVITGLVKRQRSFSFEMMLWRISHGNVFYRQTSVDKILHDPETGGVVRKVAFLVVCQGEQLSARMEKVCAGFHCNLYHCPTAHSERVTLMSRLAVNIKDLDAVLRTTRFHRCKALRAVGRQWPMWMIQIKKAKAIYHTMNLFSLDITKKCLIGQCWVPTRDLQKVQGILDSASLKVESSVPSFLSKVVTDAVPPTYHRTNKFTNGFQALINAYGDSCYRELNPGLYTIITFPFLFSLMFGDVGHGFIMFLFAAWMLKNEKKFMAENSNNEIWNIFFGGRYIILLMSLFSIYAGFIYNDLFSKGVKLKTSGWSHVSYSEEELLASPVLMVEPKDYGLVYPFGVDPAWKLAENKILFENSLKMKLSIIIGVIHMIFGLSLSLFNHMFFKKRYLIILEFIPQMLFLCCIFLWLVILVFMKWFQYGGAKPVTKESAGCAPLILIIFIDMCLFSTTKPVAVECDAYMFEGQQSVQKTLVFVALASVPIMLFGPPIFVNHKNKKNRVKVVVETSNFRKYQAKSIENAAAVAKKMEELEEKMDKLSESFGDLMIHQAVHTIEFVLSTISHTASYLRLWALSLAHAQLSEMLWMMVFSKMALQDASMAGGPKIVVVFAIWAMFSLSILVLMEGLSAFLHTLRLHWVEFMSKFYGGCGYVFRPFCFRAMLKEQVKEKMEICPSSKRNQGR
ncbi:V-type proton ATPase 116 kDa subunit a 1-like [Choristoneura fumiferana]|uniref:V-type proton ATPase 116 kDa subunit a 1-like n=1 Tax=Choristoneura fumiferana TaxID=7141 RepID=UPI003D15AFCB